MKTSLKNNKQTEEETQMVEVEESPETSLANPLGSMAADGMSGDWDEDDIKIPYMSLVQKVGDLADDFPAGSFVVNKEVVVGDGKTPIDIIFLDASKYYVEDKPFDPENLPRKFSSKAEVRLAGFSTEWGANQYAKSVSDVVCLYQCDPAHAMFTFDNQGYALALYVCQGTAFTRVAKVINTAVRQGHLRRTGLRSGMWQLTSEVVKGSKASYLAPTLRSNGIVPEDMQKWIATEVLPA